jgi:O-antigen/teichoic acid export membrane protein
MSTELLPAGESVDHSRAIARNTGLQTGAYILGLGLSVGGAAIVTRYLGVRAFGTFSLLAVLLTLPLTVINGSFDTLAVRRLSVDSDADGTFFRNVLALKLSVALTFVSLAVAVSWLVSLPLALRLAVAAFGIAIVASAVQGTLLAVEQARLRFQLPVFVDVGTRLLTLAGLLLLATAPHPQSAASRVALCVVVSAGAAVLCLTYSIARRRRSVTLRLSRNRGMWARLSRSAGPLALISLLGLVNYRLDVVVLGAMAGTHAVGIYAVATRFIDAALPLAAFFVAASFPVLAVSAANATASRQGQVQRGAEFLLLASVPLTLGGWIFAPQLIHALAGAQYDAAVLPLRVLLLSLPFSYLSTFLLFLVIAADRQRRVLPLLVGSIVLNVVLCTALIPFYSYNAPAIATLVSEVAGTSLLVMIVRRKLDIHVLSRPLLKTLAAGGAMTAAALLLAPIGTLLAIGGSAAIYVGAAFALRAVRPIDLKLLAGRPT